MGEAYNRLVADAMNSGRPTKFKPSMNIFLIALIVFIVLLIAGLYLEELTWKHVGVWVLVALVAAVVLVGVIDPSMNLYSAALAIIDLVLAVVIFREYVGRL